MPIIFEKFFYIPDIFINFISENIFKDFQGRIKEFSIETPIKIWNQFFKKFHCITKLRYIAVTEEQYVLP